MQIYDVESNKKQKVSHGMTESDVALEIFLNKSDVELVFDEIEKLSKCFHGIVFLHQVYATLNNNTIVDEQIAELRKHDTKFKFFNYTVGFNNKDCEVVIITTEKYMNDFRSSIEKHLINFDIVNAEFIDKFSIFLNTLSTLSIKHSDLHTPNNSKTSDNIDDNIYVSFSNVEIDWLLERGFLKYHLETSLRASCRSEEVYWLSHPAMGMLSRYRESAQKTILSWLKQTKYKELSEKLLTQADRPRPNSSDCNTGNCNSNIDAGFKTDHTSLGQKSISSRRKDPIKYRLDPTKESPLPIAYHLLDMIGRHVVYKVSAQATGDYIVRVGSGGR